MKRGSEFGDGLTYALPHNVIERVMGFRWQREFDVIPVDVVFRYPANVETIRPHRFGFRGRQWLTDFNHLSVERHIS
jgi:hypothetical protein